MRLRPEVWLFALVFVLGSVLLLVAPWWSLGLLSFFATLLLPVKKAWLNFFISGLAGAAVYGVATLSVPDAASTLPSMIADLFKVSSSGLLQGIVVLVGLLTAGIFSLPGSYLKRVISPSS